MIFPHRHKLAPLDYHINGLIDRTRKKIRDGTFRGRDDPAPGKPPPGLDPSPASRVSHGTAWAFTFRWPECACA